LHRVVQIGNAVEPKPELSVGQMFDAAQPRLDHLRQDCACRAAALTVAHRVSKSVAAGEIGHRTITHHVVAQHHSAAIGAECARGHNSKRVTIHVEIVGQQGRRGEGQ